MATWCSKDPDAVLDYLYTIPLDAGDSIASGDYTFEKVSGDVAIDSESLAAAPNTNADGLYGQELIAWLSGGTDGETNVFRVTWTTDAGRTDDDIITLAIAESDPIILTGYAKPGSQHLIMRYPAFAAVPVATIRYWLVDAERSVDQSWIEGDYAAGIMALAAHNMALAGIGADSSVLVDIPAGITRMKSGSLELGFTDVAANARMAGSLMATRYGQEYALLLKRSRGGPIVQPSGALPYGYPAFGYLVGWS